MTLLRLFAYRSMLVVADADYCSIVALMKVYKHLKTFVLLPAGFGEKEALRNDKQWYDDLMQVCRALIYHRRKPSIEPVFALVDALFELDGQKHLPYRGLAKVEPYLLVATVSLQVLMVFNLIHDHRLQATKPFRLALD